jgi:predicted signal transduction protein with EAL and GGDEF domain
MRESAGVRNALDRIRALGCMIALDDFGTATHRSPTSRAFHLTKSRSTKPSYKMSISP